MGGGTRRYAERLAERLRRHEAATGAPLDRGELAEVVYATLALHVPFEFACLATTDPTSGVVTWASKTRDLGVGDQEFAATEYGPPDVNKFEEIARRDPPVGVLSVDTDGHPELCRRHRDFNHPRFGFTDELRAAFVSRGTLWGAIGVYRGPGEPPFTPADAAELAEACELLAVAVQRALFRAEAGHVVPDAQGPAVLIVGGDDRATQLTPAARTAIEGFGGYDHGDLPAVVLAVVASCRTAGSPFASHCKDLGGRWLSVRAAPLEGPGNDVVVTLEPAPRAALSRMALAAHGLTAREEDVALLVLQGTGTQGIADALHLSPHTVQDHLKKVFAKVGVSSRRELTAKLVLAHSAP
jgi:DNA-binding CsgD family transcriptional regulator